MKKSNWKKYTTSAAMVALVGAGIVGAGNIDYKVLGVNVGVIEAAPVATPVNIIAFDQFALTGTAFNPLANVSAFGVTDGQLTDLTSSVEVVKNNVDIHQPGRYSVTYKATNKKGQTASKTVSIVVDINPSQALLDYQTILNDLSVIVSDLDINDEDLQNQMEALRNATTELHSEFDNLAKLIAQTDGDISLLEAKLLPLQGQLDKLYEGTVKLYTHISNLEESIEINKGLADAELARLQNQLDQEKAAHEKTIASLEKQIKEAGDGDQVAKLQKEVTDSIARYEALHKRIADRIAEVTKELPNLDNESGKIEGRDEIILKLIERNEAEINDVESQIKAVKAEREAVLEGLQAKVDGKLDGAQLEKAKSDVASAKTYFAEREKALETRVNDLKKQTDELTAQDAAYANRIEQARTLLDALRNRERELEARITKELNAKHDVEDAIKDVVTNEKPGAVEDVVEDIVDGTVDEDNSPADGTVTEDSSTKPVVPDKEQDTDAAKPDGTTDKPDDSKNDETVVDKPSTEKPDAPTDGNAGEKPDTPTDTKPTAPNEGDVVDGRDPETPVAGDEKPSETGPDSDIVIGGEDLGDDFTIMDEIPTLEDMMKDDGKVEKGRASTVSADDLVELPEGNPVSYSETEYSAGAGESVDKSATSDVAIVEAASKNKAVTLPAGDPSADAASPSADIGSTTAEAESEASTTKAVAPETAESSNGGTADGSTADGGGGTTEKEALSNADATKAENKKDGGVLPQTGAAYGAIGLAGTSGIAAIAAWFFKRRRN